MRRFLVAVFVVALPLAVVGLRAQNAPAAQPVGDPAAGKVHYTFGNTSCSNCHGVDGEGRFGPALAGRNLTYARFRAYVRNPLGRMPAYPDTELNDQEIADMVAYFNSLPKPEKAADWREPLPKMAPRGQQLVLGIWGCGQCHGETVTTPRHGAAEVTGDFEWFKRMVYTHTTTQREQMKMLEASGVQPTTPGHVGLPPGRNRLRMGNYSPARLPEKTLREMWDWMETLGVHLAVLRGTIQAGQPAPNGVTYTVTVGNEGVRDRGITNTGISVAIALPPGAKVVSTTGDYQGVRHDEEAKAEVAVWNIGTLPAADRTTFTFTLAQPAPQLRGTIRWATPKVNEEDSTIQFAYSAAGGRGRGGA